MACLSWSPSPPEWFILSAMEVQVAGGAAGQDGYAVCSGENSFFFALPMMDSIEQMMLIAWLVLCMSPLCSISSYLIIK
ncbi:hypothetical protein Bca4012_071576 [Brassica carinata]|uniref:Uncharacterized protein n=3 Tax=Brassica TaxID=3705 RepID=A0A8S9HDD4_BRACR|nr:hypothetical protein F2Q68_00014285 [Brassica cretica]KAG2269278.1 hypothetical protein Bca52824_063833 [Brassica carinata]CAF1928105.1 unnamed protein product [Brassica napus]